MIDYQLVRGDKWFFDMIFYKYIFSDMLKNGC